jgi:hypothetical protein
MLFCPTCLNIESCIELAERAYAEKRGRLADFPSGLPVKPYRAARVAANDALIDLRLARAERDGHHRAHSVWGQALLHQ